MKPRMILTLLLYFLLFAVPLIAQQTSSASAATDQASAAVPIPSYPDSPAGLEKLIKDILKMQKDGDGKELAAYVQSLVLPDPAAWFTATFGGEIGAELAASYDRTRIDLPLSFPDMLADLESKHVASPLAIRFTDSCNSNASDTEYPLLLRRTNAQPLYEVRFGSAWQYFSVKYFAYADGAFRWLGNFKLRAPEFPPKKMNAGAGPESQMKLKVGGNVMAAKLIKEVKPEYPSDARYQGMQGTVILHALINKEGNIQDLQVLQGSCSLAKAAVKAVSQWRYSPTMLQGQPVQVDTTISVIFQLGG